MNINSLIDSIQLTTPKWTKYGQLYSNIEQTKKSFALVRMFVIIQASDGETRLHESLFGSSKKKRTGAEWSAWFVEHFSEIYTKNILPNITPDGEGSEDWRVLKIIGWRGEMAGTRYVKRKSRHSAMVIRRNKTKRQRAKRGKNNLRRGHRNRRR